MEYSKKPPVASVQSVKTVFNTDTCPLTPVAYPILLVAVNARYSHSSYSVRSIKANLAELEKQCVILEADLDITPLQLATYVIEKQPAVIGFSVYLWNVRIIEATARILRKTAPQIKLVAGGPELTAEYANADLFDLCIIGEGESAMREYCRKHIGNYCGSDKLSRSETPDGGFLSFFTMPPPLQQSASGVKSSIVTTETEETQKLKLPWHLYSDADIASRVVYVEAARGCPYHCAYCTSASTGLRVIPLERVLTALGELWDRGVRQFKFLDRSFTAAQQHAHAIMDFFLERAAPEMKLHFEINTDLIHADTIARVKAFPPGNLHLECGIQTLNPQVAKLVGRSAEIGRTLSNLTELVNQSGADVHADLILGLPGEDEESFATGFNRLLKACQPSAVQVNLLKGLPGTDLAKKALQHKLIFNSEPPYELLQSAWIDFNTLARIQRLARCWELVYNRGHLPGQAGNLLKISDNVYGTFMRLADYIYTHEGRMYKISRSRLTGLVEEFLRIDFISR